MRISIARPTWSISWAKTQLLQTCRFVAQGLKGWQWWPSFLRRSAVCSAWGNHAEWLSCKDSLQGKDPKPTILNCTSQHNAVQVHLSHIYWYSMVHVIISLKLTACNCMEGKGNSILIYVNEGKSAVLAQGSSDEPGPKINHLHPQECIILYCATVGSFRLSFGDEKGKQIYKIISEPDLYPAKNNPSRAIFQYGTISLRVTHQPIPPWHCAKNSQAGNKLLWKGTCHSPKLLRKRSPLDWKWRLAQIQEQPNKNQKHATDIYIKWSMMCVVSILVSILASCKNCANVFLFL